MAEINGAQVPNVGEVVPPVVNPAPVQAGQVPTATVTVKKGKNPALIIVALSAVVILLIVVAVVVIVVLNGNRAGTTTTFTPKDTSNLTKVDNSAYTFYYPKAYTKVSVTEEDGLLENYQSKTENAFSGFNSVNLVSSNEETPITKQSDCTVMGTSLVSFYVSEFGVAKEDVTNTKADYFNQNGMVGCDLRFKISILSKYFYIDQALFTKTGGKTTYVVSASNDKGTGSEYDDMRAAVESFLIK